VAYVEQATSDKRWKENQSILSRAVNCFWAPRHFYKYALGSILSRRYKKATFDIQTIKNNFDMTYIEEGEVSLSNTF
jgi:hypothetical protein